MLRIIKRLWQRQIEWVIARVQEDPPMLRQPRSMCEHHAAGCYLCPRDHCSGMLNNPDDPDPNKPKPHTTGHCIYFFGADGTPGMRVRMGLRDANDYYARRAIDQGYSDIRTLEMMMADRDCGEAAPGDPPNNSTAPVPNPRVRPGNVVW